MSRFKNGYTEDWDAVKDLVRAEAGGRCVRCGHPHDPKMTVACDSTCTHAYTIVHGERRSPQMRCLTVHHLDGDKSNNRWWNLLPLCQVCHLQVQAKVIPERPYLFRHQPWFEPYACGFYAYFYGKQEITRADADADPDRWLAMGQPWLYPAAVTQEVP